MTRLARPTARRSVGEAPLLRKTVYAGEEAGRPSKPELGKVEASIDQSLKENYHSVAKLCRGIETDILDAETPPDPTGLIGIVREFDALREEGQAFDTVVLAEVLACVPEEAGELIVSPYPLVPSVAPRQAWAAAAVLNERLRQVTRSSCWACPAPARNTALEYRK